ncbi:pyridoxamine 5'-phosphate oxidase family protein [Nocardioides limicola]|uniref:pyridoxamine 5'-phosphate oxidase family protein n=1 Tax=Nocardioides limicola TaxID=2803368 RepID=UPI00193B9DF8|nr:pyridoxamine 5'-phosphate oxidase family protein [Nocardioides sp. DJM-14]
MSIPVDVAELARTLADFGAGYLLTVSPEGAVKAVTVEPVVDAGELLIPAAGRGTVANLAGNPRVTLVFPPGQPRGYTLLIDGTGVVIGDDVRVHPDSAVLHRPASHADGPPAPSGASAEPSGCGDDCRPAG